MLRGSASYLGHLQIAELVPEILNRVQTDESSNKEANPLDAAHASDRDTSHHEPETPLGRERVVPKLVELGPAENGCEGEAEQHRVEKDEPADGRVRVLEQNSERDEPDGWPPEVERLRSVVGQGNADGSESAVEQAHEGVVELRRVCLAGLELERAVVSSQIS